MECVPAARAVVFSVAVPPAFNEAFPRLVVPSKNLIEPVGTPLPDCGTTLAVNATRWPIVIWVAEAVSIVVVATAICVTTTLTGVVSGSFGTDEIITKGNAAHLQRRD
jgi:hypothetical protein